MRDINGADFRFAKTLTLPFFGSGMVDLPPGGTKRVKNSRKMQMVFFVFYGRVLVELGTPTQRFSIGRGGMWQVPRGELGGRFLVLQSLLFSVPLLFFSPVYFQAMASSTGMRAVLYCFQGAILGQLAWRGSVVAGLDLHRRPSRSAGLGKPPVSHLFVLTSALAAPN